MPTSDPVYDAAFFKALFAAIPDEQWTDGTVCDFDGRRCARGHAGDYTFRGPTNRGRIEAFDALFEPFAGKLDSSRYGRIHTPSCLAAQISNGNVTAYQQPTPRARILAALDDLIAGTVPAA